MPRPAQEPLSNLALSLRGRTLEGSEGRRYPLGELIGEGGQGWVFRATWNGSIDVVVKVLRPDAVTPEGLGRFRREAQVLKALAQQASPNPHVVRFFDHAYSAVELSLGEPPWTLPFTVLEYVEGVTLEKAMRDARPAGIGLERARRILRHVVFALRDVHAHDVIHRDLKPSNILLASPGHREIAKVTDFGLAKLLNPGLLQTVTLAGATVGYAPPEQFEKGNLRVGRHTDVFSLAAIFYELVSGLPAFPLQDQGHPLFAMIRILAEARPAFARVLASIPRELAQRPDAVAALDAELARALSPKPEERHGTVVELHEAIEHVLSALGVTLLIPTIPPPKAPLEPDLAKTIRAEDLGPRPEPVRIRSSPPERPPSAPPSARAQTPLAWRVACAPVAPSMALSISVSARGEAAVAAGPLGLAAWGPHGWTRLDLPPPIDTRSFRATAWQGGTAYFAGASPMVVGLTGEGRVVTFRFETSGVTFHGASADPAGVLLAGERMTPEGAVGVLAEIPLATPARPMWLVDVAPCGPLRAVVRTPGGLVACGDDGALVIGREGQSLHVTRPCSAHLTAALASISGAVIVVGRGGFVFHVPPASEARLEAMPTTRDLLALASAADGTAWCGGAEQRVIRRDPDGWVRLGSLPGSASIRALHVGASRALAFADDGGVLTATLG